MLMFKVSQDKGLGDRVTSILRSGGTPVWHTQTDSGLKIVITHGTEDGILPAYDRIDQDYMVVCCFPKRVKARYPHLKVAGSWDEITMHAYHEGSGTYLLTPLSKLYEMDNYEQAWERKQARISYQ